VLNNNFNKLTLSYYLFMSFLLSKRAFNFVWEDSVHLSRTALVASFFCYLALVNLYIMQLKKLTLYQKDFHFLH
jgi:hypothetical protein